MTPLRYDTSKSGDGDSHGEIQSTQSCQQIKITWQQQKTVTLSISEHTLGPLNLNTNSAWSVAFPCSKAHWPSFP